MQGNGRHRPIAVDLFAGAGGLALGAEMAGADIAVAVEYDPIHAAIHKLNFPATAVLCRDVREVSGDDIREAGRLRDADIDLVVGGPPCQGYSLIGHRLLQDPRNELVFHFARLVDELRPKAFVFENVAGMATGRHHALLDELIERFRQSGYQLRLPYSILNAADYGVPQDRRRLFLLGTRTREFVLPSYPPEATQQAGKPRRSSGNGNVTLPFHPVGPTVLDAIGDLPELEKHKYLYEDDVLRAPKYRGGSVYAKKLRGDVADEDDFSQPRVHDRGVLTGCLLAEHSAESRKRFAATETGETEPISRFYRLPPDGVCNTLRAGTATDRGAFSAPRPIHPVYPRCITVREAARLHSYPDWFRFHKTIWHGFRQIGNSVPPLLGRAVTRAVLEAIGAPRIRPLSPEELAGLNMRQAAEFFGVSSTVIPSRQRGKQAVAS